jgi:uncharacterized BrkB/YihY/UPF0761 family membrane protein
MPFVFDFGSILIVFLILLIIVAIVAIVSSVFWVMMLVDCAKRDFKDKMVWILIILFTHVLGATLYYYAIKKVEDKKRTKT